MSQNISHEDNARKSEYYFQELAHPVLYDATQLNGEGVAPPDPSGDKYSEAKIDGFLVDLNGTITKSGGLIDGAARFIAWLQATRKPFVLLSNTGAKARGGIQRKFRLSPYSLGGPPIDFLQIHTAANAQVAFMCQHLPRGSRVLILGGGSAPQPCDIATEPSPPSAENWRSLLRQCNASLVDSWTIRTSLTDAEAKRWAVNTYEGSLRQSYDGSESPKTAVALFLDGSPPPQDWSYSLITQASFLLGHGAELVYTSDDPYISSYDEAHGEFVFPLPGPGMFAQMLIKGMDPESASKRVFCCGKGGNRGKEWMVNSAVRLLCKQGHSGDFNKIVMVGDSFCTDIRAGVECGMRTCLVGSGIDSVATRHWYPYDPATWYAPSIGQLVPPSFVFDDAAAAELALVDATDEVLSQEQLRYLALAAMITATPSVARTASYLALSALVTSEETEEEVSGDPGHQAGDESILIGGRFHVNMPDYP